MDRNLKFTTEIVHTDQIGAPSASRETNQEVIPKQY